MSKLKMPKEFRLTKKVLNVSLLNDEQPMMALHAKLKLKKSVSKNDILKVLVTRCRYIPKILLFLVLRLVEVAEGFIFSAGCFLEDAPLTVVLTSLEMLLLIETANFAHSTLRSTLATSPISPFS